MEQGRRGNVTMPAVDRRNPLREVQVICIAGYPDLASCARDETAYGFHGALVARHKPDRGDRKRHRGGGGHAVHGPIDVRVGEQRYDAEQGDDRQNRRVNDDVDNRARGDVPDTRSGQSESAPAREFADSRNDGEEGRTAFADPTSACHGHEAASFGQDPPGHAAQDDRTDLEEAGRPDGSPAQ
jgi:hypothetical protein